MRWTGNVALIGVAMGRAYTTILSLENLKGLNHLGDSHIDGRKKIKLYLKDM
jgi:hypothetical protein